MRKTAKFAAIVASAATVTAATLTVASLPVQAADTPNVIEEGKELAFDRKKGNCLACHAAGDGESPGNIGPPLIAMKARFPDKAKLRAQIWDATKANPGSRMPPFGKYKIVSEEELDKIVEYIYTL